MGKHARTAAAIAEVIERTAQAWPRRLTSARLRAELRDFANDIERAVRATTPREQAIEGLTTLTTEEERQMFLLVQQIERAADGHETSLVVGALVMLLGAILSRESADQEDALVAMVAEHTRRMTRRLRAATSATLH